MELKPTKAQILWLAEKYNTVPLSTTLPATVTPTQVLQKLKTVSRHCYMLESCEDKESSGRYTFLGFDPQAEIHCKDGKGTVIDENGSRTFTGSPKPHIAALLDTDTLRRYIKICDTLGLSALVEAHDHREIAGALAAGARVIGVNNRNLKDFTVDVHNSSRYRALVPAGIRFVSESGITTSADIEVLRQNGTDAALIGEALMRAPNRRAAVEALLR
jgi:anthranilate/para-aminobenzoate synthase component I